MRLSAEGADLCTGRRSCRRYRCPCHPSADGTAGWRLRTSELTSCTRYVLSMPARNGVESRAEWTLTGVYTFSAHLAITFWGVGHSRLPGGTCCFHVERATQGPEVGWTLAETTCCTEVEFQPRRWPRGWGWDSRYSLLCRIRT